MAHLLTSLLGPTVLHALLRAGLPFLLPLSAYELRTEAAAAPAVAGGVLLPLPELSCLAVRLPRCPPLSGPLGFQVRTATGRRCPGLLGWDEMGQGRTVLTSLS